MSQIEEFKEKAMKDPALRAEVSALAGKSRPEIIAAVNNLAARHGYTLSESEVAAAVDKQATGGGVRDLNEEELDRVAGGECYAGYNADTFGHL